MNSSARWEQFAGSIGMTTAKSKSSIWYDFEEFIIEGIIISDTNSRLFNSLFFVIQNSINILSPNKLYKIAKIYFNTNKQWKILGFMIDMSIVQTRNKTQWGNFLKKIPIKKNKLQLFKVKAFRENKKFLKWYLLSDDIDFKNKSKYLREKQFFSHQLIKSRLMGTKIVYADILYFKSKHKNQNISFRKLSNIIHHDPAQICEAMGNLSLIT